MTRHAFLALALLGLTLSACGGGGADDGGGGPLTGVADFMHTTTAASVNGATSEIDHPLSNSNPDAVVLVTHVWNPGGIGGAAHEPFVGVSYDDAP